MTSLNEQQFSVKKLMNMESADAMFYNSGIGTSDRGGPMPEKYAKTAKRVYTPPPTPGSDAEEMQNNRDTHAMAETQAQGPVYKEYDRVKDVAKYKMDQSKGEYPGGTPEQSQRYRHLYAHMAEMGERAHGLPPVEVSQGVVTQGHHRIAIANELGWHSLPVEGY